MSTKLLENASTADFTNTEKSNTDIDWEQLSYEVDNMTDMVLSCGFNQNFQKSIFGKYFNDSFYDQSQGKSRFQQVTHVHGFTMLLAFKVTDINFDIDDNPIAIYARQYEEIFDVDEMTFIFECAFKDAYLTTLDRQEEVYIEIERSPNTCTTATSVADVQDIDRLTKRLWNSPDYCTNLREKVINFIFEEDPIVRKNNMSFEQLVKDYNGTKKSINDLLLVEKMLKI
jgi:hypothetical protein